MKIPYILGFLIFVPLKHRGATRDNRHDKKEHSIQIKAYVINDSGKKRFGHL